MNNTTSEIPLKTCGQTYSKISSMTGISTFGLTIGRMRIIFLMLEDEILIAVKTFILSTPGLWLPGGVGQFFSICFCKEKSSFFPKEVNSGLPYLVLA